MDWREVLISVIDYGLSNLTCVCSAVKRLGYEVQVVSNPEQLAFSTKIILPGVGAFGDAMANLKKSGMDKELTFRVIEKGIPFLGICLGAQLVCAASEEFGIHEGLGWFDCIVSKIPSNDSQFRVPHTGWDDLRWVRDSSLKKGIGDAQLFYFTHSYGIVARSEKGIVAFCDYSIPLVSVLEHENILATQFHPEKSQKSGLDMLNNFLTR